MAETPFPGQVLAAAELAGRLHSGSAALFPTDTVPALAARPEAAAQLWQLKRRPARKPMILMGADAEALFAALEVPIRLRSWPAGSIPVRRPCSPPTRCRPWRPGRRLPPSSGSSSAGRPASP